MAVTPAAPYNRLAGLAARCRTVIGDERGAAAVMLGLALPVMVGGMGLGAEVGFWYLTERKLQHAADLAAYSGAVRKRVGDSKPLIEASAKSIATQSGYKDASGTFALNTPPMAGSFVGDAASVEVVVTRTMPALFSAIFKDEPITVSVRAVAQVQPGGGGKACVLALSPNASGALKTTGSTNLSMAGCDLASNSIADDSFLMDGSSQVAADCVQTVGGMSLHRADKLTLSGCPAARQHAPKILDPYADVEQPANVGTCNSGKNLSGNIEATENHPSGMKVKRFCGGVTLKGDVNFAPGLYIIDGGDVDVDFTINGNVNVTGTGVTFFLTNAAMKFNGNANIDFSAPTTGPLAGIIIFGDRSDTLSHKLNGGADSTITGAIYVPGAAIDMSGNASTSGGCTQLIANTIAFSGSSSMAHDCAGKGTKDIVTNQQVRLVE